MADITFPKELIERLQTIADKENRTPAEVVSSLLDKQYPASQSDISLQHRKSSEELAREVILRVYERARRYWREHGKPEKAAMTDAEMDEQFWLFDQNDIPRLKSEQGQVELLPGSLYAYVKHIEENNGIFYSGKTDTVEHSREILENEYGDYLMKRIQESYPDE